MDCYNVVKDSWYSKLGPPNPRDSLAACASKGKIYTSGGSEVGEYRKNMDIFAYCNLTRYRCVIVNNYCHAYLMKNFYQHSVITLIIKIHFTCFLSVFPLKSHIHVLIKRYIVAK